MSITVGDIFTRFPNFAPENMRILVGSSDYPMDKSIWDIERAKMA